MHLQIFDPASQDNEPSRVGSHPACDFEGSRIASDQLSKYLRYCWTDRPVTRGSVFPGRQSIGASQSASDSRTKRIIVASLTAKGFWSWIWRLPGNMQSFSSGRASQPHRDRSGYRACRAGQSIVGTWGDISEGLGRCWFARPTTLLASW